MDTSSAVAVPAGGYRPRPIRFLEQLELPSWRLKVIGIAANGDKPAPVLVDAGKLIAAEYLASYPTSQRHYGVGFLGVHDGNGENQVFLDRWVNENELMHVYWTSPKHDPQRLTQPSDDHNSVCVWDLYVEAFEREAWLKHVLANPGGPNLDAYLATRIYTVV